jgi:replication-associated recombination protein RarA
MNHCIIVGPQGSGKTRFAEKVANFVSKHNIAYVYSEYLAKFKTELATPELFEKEYAFVDVVVLDEINDIDEAKRIATMPVFENRFLIVVTQTTVDPLSSRRFVVIELPIPDDEKQCSPYAKSKS